jgi:metal-dependent hydrolase (beta-lactamase superfamily II)
MNMLCTYIYELHLVGVELCVCNAIYNELCRLYKISCCCAIEIHSLLQFIGSCTNLHMTVVGGMHLICRQYTFIKIMYVLHVL